VIVNRGTNLPERIYIFAILYVYICCNCRIF